jgi:tetratricopeptide (TPR) repeat protein
MKKSVLLGLLLVVPMMLFAQEANVYESEHYVVTTVGSGSSAKDLAMELEAYLQVFNSYFRFNTTSLSGKLKVRIMESKERFDQYIQRLIGETRDDYVYLHYSNPIRSELVGFYQGNELPSSRGLVHQGFVQFLRAFVPNPPLWMREGFATYFESMEFDAVRGKAKFRENLAWLETWKTLSQETGSLIALKDLLTLSPDQAKASIDIFYPQAWALVHYLSQTSEKTHTRLLWDSIYSLKTVATLSDNSDAVASRAFVWVDSDDLLSGMEKYYDGKKTFPELIRIGMDAYNAGKATDSQKAFESASALNPDSFIPPYYLGLILYDAGQHALAEVQYQRALELGADAALTNYALGVNSFANNDYDQAEEYLAAALALDESYEEKVQEIRSRMTSDDAGSELSINESLPGSNTSTTSK